MRHGRRDRADLHGIDRRHPRPTGTGAGTCRSSATGTPRSCPRAAGVAAQSSIAFFPGYPTRSAALSAPFGLSPVLVGCVRVLVAGLIATVGLWHLAARLSDERHRGPDRRALRVHAVGVRDVDGVRRRALRAASRSCACSRCSTGGGWRRELAAAARRPRSPTAVALVIACLWAARRRDPHRRFMARAPGSRDRAVGDAAVPRVQLAPHRRGARLLPGGVARMGEPHRPGRCEHPRRAPSPGRGAADVLRRVLAIVVGGLGDRLLAPHPVARPGRS